jgi:hypothetical protein
VLWAVASAVELELLGPFSVAPLAVEVLVVL